MNTDYLQPRAEDDISKIINNSNLDLKIDDLTKDLPSPDGLRIDPDLLDHLI